MYKLLDTNASRGCVSSAVRVRGIYTRGLLRILTIVCLLVSAPGVLLAQSSSTNGVPFISQVTPPSLPLTTYSGYGSATLLILGANFPQNAVVNLTAFGNVVHPTSTIVNASGSQITAQFANTLPSSPGVFTVTVTNPNGTLPTTSSLFYLPQTPTTSTVQLNQNTVNAVIGTPQSLLVANLQGNGLPSLAIVSTVTNSVSTELDIFSGYEAGYTVSTGQQPWGIATGDALLGDNVPELAVTNTMDNTVSLFVGDGSYRAYSTVPVPGVFPTGIAFGDFNRDGLMDLAVVNTCGTSAMCFPTSIPQGPGSVTILLSNGDGTFSASPAQLTTGNIPYAIATADLNGDGILDLVVANSVSNTLSVFMGNGDGTFTQTSASPATGNNPMALAIGDFNGDGFLDIAVTNTNDNTVSILLNQNCPSIAATACTFAPASVSPLVGPGPIAIAAGDLNADGYMDLVTANATGDSVTILLGNGAGAFTAVTPPQGSPSFSTGNGPDGVVLADFNQDGRLDIITSNRSGSYSVLQQAVVAQLQLTSSITNFVYGMIPTLSLQILPGPAPASPTGTVTLYDGSTSVTSATSQYGFQLLLPLPYFFGAGTHQLTAVYSGDANYAPLTSNLVTLTVSQATTSTALTSSPSKAPYGIAVTLSATIQPQTVSTATGTVTFVDATNSTTLGTLSVSNNAAQLTLPSLAPGTHMIFATYSGDANCVGSSSSLISVTITQVSTSLNLSVAPAQAQFAQTVMFTAALQTQSGGSGVPTGTMSFYDGSTLLGTSPIANNSATFSTSTLALGSHIISAQYSGDANFLGVSSGPTTVTVTKAATTTIVSSSLTPSVYGQNVTYSATTTPAFGSLPAGQISFFDGGTLLATLNATNGVAQYTLQSLTGGTHSITAQWMPTSNYSASTSTALAQIVTPAATTLGLSTNINPSYYGQQILLNISLNPAYSYPSNGATVTVFDNGNSLGPFTFVSGSSASFPISTLASGTHVLTATYAGDVNLQGSSTTSGFAQTVNQASTSSSAALTSYSTLYGASVTITGSVSSSSSLPETGTFSFYDGTTLLGTAPVSGARAQYTTSSLLPGTHAITVQYGGDANFLASTSSPAQTLTVSKDPTLTSVSVDVNPSMYGQTVTLTAAVQLQYGSGATGSISFFDGTTLLGTAPYSNGGAKFAIATLGGGSHSITAQYSGDAYFASSSSTALTETINSAATSITVAAGANPATFGQPVTLTATVQPPGGTMATGSVTFVDGSYGIGTGTLANNTAQLTVSFLAVGSHSITAVYSGNANLTGSTSSTLSETIGHAATTSTVSSSLNPAFFAQSVVFSITIQSSSSGTPPTGTVTLLDGSSSLGSSSLPSGGLVQFTISGLAVGSHAISATYSGDANFSGSTSAVLVQTVNLVPTTTSVTSSVSPGIADQPITLNAAVQPSTATGTITFLDGTTPLGTSSISNGSAQITLTLAVGSHTISASYSGDATFAPGVSPAIVEVVNAPPVGAGGFFVRGGTKRLTAAAKSMQPSYNAQPQQGDLLVAYVWWNSSTATISSVTDNCNNTWVATPAQLDSVDGAQAQLFYVAGSKLCNASATLTVTFSSAVIGRAVLGDWSGMGAGAVYFDAGATNFSTATTTPSSNVSTNNMQDLIIQVAAGDNSNGVFTSAGGFKNRVSSIGMVMADSTVSTAQNYSASLTDNVSDNILSGVFGFELTTAPAFPVQSSLNAATAASISCSYPQNVRAGDVLAAYVWWPQNSSVTMSVADNINGAWLPAGGQATETGTPHSSQLFYLANTAAGAVTITATPSNGASQQLYMECTELSGMATSNVLDGTPATAFSTKGSTSLNVGPVTTSDANDLLLLGCSTNAGNGFKVPSGFLQLQEINHALLMVGPPSSAGSYSTTCSGGGALYTGNLAAFQ